MLRSYSVDLSTDCQQPAFIEESVPMKRYFLLAVALTAAVSFVQATTLYKYTFDNTTSTTFGPNQRYVPGLGEIETNVTGTGSALGALSVTNGTTSPTFVSIASLGGVNSPVQGGQAVRFHAGPTADGIDVDFDPSFAGPFSMTIEASFLIKTLIPTSNTVGLAYLFSTEWPTSSKIDHNLRTLNGTLQYVVTNNTEPEVAVNTSAPLVINRWYHAAGVINYNSTTPASSTVQLYLDGVSQGTATVNLSAGRFAYFLGNTHSGSNRTLGNMFAVGHNPGSDSAFTGDQRGFDGAIDAIAVSSAALGPGTFVLTQPSAASDWEMYE
jgi:hypothetical protein